MHDALLSGPAARFASPLALVVQQGSPRTPCVQGTDRLSGVGESLKLATYTSAESEPWPLGRAPQSRCDIGRGSVLRHACHDRGFGASTRGQARASTCLWTRTSPHGNLHMRAKASTPSSIDSAVESAPLETLYTVADVAARFQTGREEIHRWIRSGHLTAFRIGKFVRIRADALAEFEHRQLTSTRSKR